VTSLTLPVVCAGECRFSFNRGDYAWNCRTKAISVSKSAGLTARNWPPDGKRVRCPRV